MSIRRSCCRRRAAFWRRATCGFAIESLDYRYDPENRSRKKRILSLAFRCVPRRFHRDIVLVARKVSSGPGLAPLA